MNDQGSHHRRLAFTVPELLAVVAIIAIIMSILLPSMTTARKHTYSAICASNLRQLTTAWRTYASDTRGRFVPSWQSNGGYTIGVGTHWYIVIETYYEKNKDLLLCPSAALKMHPPGPAGNFGTATHAMKVGSPSVHRGITDRDYVSYGLNNWLEDPSIVGTGSAGGRPNDWFIDRLSSAGGFANTPVLGDGVWPDQGWPLASDLKPGSSIDPMAFATSGYMQRFYLDRHMEAVNLSYIDCSVNSVKIKNLWSQKWHRLFVTVAEIP